MSKPIVLEPNSVSIQSAEGAPVTLEPSDSSSKIFLYEFFAGTTVGDVVDALDEPHLEDVVVLQADNGKSYALAANDFKDLSSLVSKHARVELRDVEGVGHLSGEVRHIADTPREDTVDYLAGFAKALAGSFGALFTRPHKFLQGMSADYLLREEPDSWRTTGARAATNATGVTLRNPHLEALGEPPAGCSVGPNKKKP